MRAFSSSRLVSSERGATLVVAVLVLVALTLIGLAAVLSSNLATDASGNLKGKMTAYHMAEACMYTQINRIKIYGISTTALTCAPGQTNDLDATGTCDLGSGYTCTASAPTLAGGSAGYGGTPDGWDLNTKISKIPYEFTVTGSGPRGSVSQIRVGISVVASGGGGQ